LVLEKMKNPSFFFHISQLLLNCNLLPCHICEVLFYACYFYFNFLVFQLCILK
jgi:hypothetical protein